MVVFAVALRPGLKPARVKDTNTGKMRDDWMEPSRKMMMDFDFLSSLIHFDKEHIPADIITRIRPFVNDPELQPEKVRSTRQRSAVFCARCAGLWPCAAHHCMGSA